MYPLNIQVLPLASLRIDPENPREIDEVFDDHNALFRSIRDEGIMVAVSVSDQGDGSYLVVDGNRRVLCARQLEFETMLCRIYPRLSPAEIESRRFLTDAAVKDWTREEKRRPLRKLKGLGVPVDPADEYGL